MRSLLVVVVLVVAACSSSASAGEQVRGSVDQFVAAFEDGDGDAAVALMSERCADDEDLRLAVAVIAGTELEVGGYSEDVDGDAAVVSYSFPDAPEFDQADERWLLEDGRWVNDDC